MSTRMSSGPSIARDRGDVRVGTFLTSGLGTRNPVTDNGYQMALSPNRLVIVYFQQILHGCSRVKHRLSAEPRSMASKFTLKSVFVGLSLSFCAWFPLALASPQVPRSSESRYGCRVYDSNPEQIWNRLFSILFIRQYKGGTYGVDELDPLFWTETRFLLSEPSHSSALHILDEFLEAKGQNQVHDSVKRAVLEHDLWAVFDWSALPNTDHPEQRRELQIRLAEVMRRIAPSKNEIASLPDNYKAAVESGEFARQYDPSHRDRAFLPPDLFQAEGNWVCIAGSLGAPVAKLHTMTFSGRSRFIEFIRLPQGRKATLDYLRALRDYLDPQGRQPMGDRIMLSSSAVPQFPAGTELALVRQMNLFDHDGSLVSAPITESVQIRVFHNVPANGANWQYDQNAAATSQDVYEIKLNRANLFAGKSGGLGAVTRDDQDFRILQSHGFDFDGPVRTLDGCAKCHTGSGIYSVRSIASLLKPSQAQGEATDACRNEATTTLSWKQDRYNWRLLNGYWKSVPLEGPRQ
jgi:hypothetical protein